METLSHIPKCFFIAGSLFAFLAVSAGAFGSHLLKHKLTPEQHHIYEIAVRYQMYHALALLLVAAIMPLYSPSLLPYVGWAFISGIIIFSGSLYILVFTGNKQWGMITPIGGFLFLIGWLLALIGGIFS